MVACATTRSWPRGPDPVTNKRRQRKKTFTTKREAQAGLTAWLASIEGGTAVERSRQTVAQMMNYWLDTYARHNCRPKTVYDYTCLIRTHIIPTLGAIQVQKLTPDTLQAFYSEKLAAGCGPRTVEMCHQRLSTALKQAVRLGLVSRNVCDLVTPPRVAAREMATWDGDQARRFLAVAEQSAYGPIWLVALATGLRRGELLGLRWRDVDLDRRTLSIRQTVGLVGTTVVAGQPKTRSGRRTIPVPADVIEALREHRRRQNERRLALGSIWQHHDLAFAATNGNSINPNNLRRDHTRLVTLAGVPRIRIHGVRHTHATLALQQGANIKAVSQRLGHARTSITMDVYAHVLPEQAQDVSEKVGAVLFRRRAEGAS
jgi:integrase